MLTEHDIESKALEHVADGEAPLWGGGFVQGAMWANDQNEKELANLRTENEHLKAIEQQHIEFVLSATKTAERMNKIVLSACAKKAAK